MALPTTNLSLNAIHVEVGGTSGTQVSLNDADVRGIGNPNATYAGSDGINTTSGSQISIGEFRGASAVQPFDFTTSSPINFPSGFMTIDTYYSAYHSHPRVEARSIVTLNFNASNITASAQDTYGGSAQTAAGSSTHTVGTASYSNTSDIASIQARWVISNGRLDFYISDTMNADYLISYNNGTSQTIRTGSQGDNFSLYHTGNWVTVTPTRFGGSASNSQTHELRVSAQAGYSYDEVELTLNSGGYIELQVRVNRTSGGSDTMSYRESYSSSSDPRLEATSVEWDDYDDSAE